MSTGQSPIDDSWTQKMRMDFLIDSFEPRPGMPVVIEEKTVINKKTSVETLNLLGWIKIKPKPGVCLTITRRVDLRDIIVCEERRLSFRAQDLELNGTLRWKVSTGPKDFGTDVTWTSSYRYIRVVDESMPWPGPSRILVLKSCQAIQSKVLGKRIVLSFLEGFQWSVSFPEADILAPQPTKPKPNLFIQESVISTGFIKVETQEEKTAKEKVNRQSSEKFKDKIDESDPNKLKSPWQMYPRDAYQMDGSNFKGLSSPPPNMNSVCRYKYESSDAEGEGELECHDVTDYKWFYARVPCLPQLKRSGAKH